MIPAHAPVCPKDIRINTDEIPASVRKELALGAVELTWELFSEPGTRKRYEAWLAERNANMAARVAAEERS